MLKDVYQISYEKNETLLHKMLSSHNMVTINSHSQKIKIIHIRCSDVCEILDIRNSFKSQNKRKLCLKINKSQDLAI